MLLGVVSDTHNNLKSIDRIISIFNEKEVIAVVHTGDITNVKSLKKFTQLNCNLYGVYGNNDREEAGLKEEVEKNSFRFEEPPLLINKNEIKIAIFHEPDWIENFLIDNEVDIVLHGHTHRYRKEIVEDTLIFNPGESAGLLKGKNAIGLIDLKSLEAERIFF